MFLVSAYEGVARLVARGLNQELQAAESWDQGTLREAADTYGNLAAEEKDSAVHGLYFETHRKLLALWSRRNCNN